MAGIKDYSTTQANNTSLNGISTAEGMLPSNLNNAIRALMKNTRDWYNDSQWVEYGDGSGAYTAAYASATSFTIAGVDVTSFYHADRRIKVIAPTPGTIYGTISSSSFSTNTTVNVTWDSGNLSNEAITNVFVAALSKTNTSIPGGVIGTTQLADGSVTTAKIAADAVNGSKIADDSIDSEHYVDGSIDTAHIADSQITVAKMAANSVDSDQYVDGSIDTIHIADSQITNPKMAANSVDSDQYVDGSIDTAHIGDSQVTTAKIADSNITSAKILDGTIVNADINASAAIDATKIHDGTISNTEFGYLNGVTSAIQTQIDSKLTASSNLSDVSSASTARTNLGLGTIATQDANNVSISGGAVTGLGSPSASSDAATKNYVDQAVAGLRTRTIAECASTANVNLSNGLEAGDSIDGVTLVAGDRVLLKDQTDATENGLYLAVSSGAASRDPEHDTIAELSGGMVVVNQGSTNDNKIFLCTTDNTGSVGSTNITYTVITPSNVGTVTSVGVADSGSSEFTVANSPITSSGTITLAVNSIANTKITGLGTASTKTVGTSANNVVQLDGSAKLPAVDGSQLTNIDAASAGFAIAMAIAL
nr:prophage MuMc02 [uncultured Mediterranean phage uvMED]BAR18380.1 prophage MuMc02 [uncultured Mediterranean phage uvMED]